MLPIYAKSFVCLKGSKNPKQIWFCFHFLGGTASAYFSWSKFLPEHVVLYSAQLPGRGERSSENFLLHYQHVVEEYTQLFKQQKIPLPFIFFGHSMGAILAYEILAKLENNIDLSQGTLAISSCKAPHNISPSAKTYLLSDADFIRKLKRYGGTPDVILNDQALLDLFLPRLRADTELLETYQCQQFKKLSVPILAMGGSSDTVVAPDAIYAWQQYTDKNFDVKHYSGGHFYLKEIEFQVVNDILHWGAMVLE